MTDEYFAPWLRRQLARRDMLQADLARRMNASSGMVSMWARGVRRPSPESCERIADVFGMQWDEVLAVAGHRQRDEKDPNDALRDELKSIIDRLPSPQLATVRPMLLGLYQDTRRERLKEDTARRASG